MINDGGAFILPFRRPNDLIRDCRSGDIFVSAEFRPNVVSLNAFLDRLPRHGEVRDHVA
jgi:hypothetical protein